MVDLEKIKGIVGDFIAGTDMFVVDIKLGSGDKVDVTLDSDTTVSIDKCVELSRLINGAFDKDVEDFELTVASAGIGQPLKLPRQYAKILGKTVEIVLKKGEKYEGTLTAADEEKISIEFEEKQAVEGMKRKQLVSVTKTFALDEIKWTKLQISFK